MGGPQRVIRSIRACSQKSRTSECRTSDTSPVTPGSIILSLYHCSSIDPYIPRSEPAPCYRHRSLLSPTLSPIRSSVSPYPGSQLDQDVRHSYQHHPDTPPHPADRSSSPLIALPPSIRPGESQGQGKRWERRSICARAAGRFSPIAQSGR